MGKRSAVVELFLGDMGSIQRELRPSTQREDQLTMETKLEQIAVKAVNQLPKAWCGKSARHVLWEPGAGDRLRRPGGMGNGALPNGLSYRAHPRLYLFGRHTGLRNVWCWGKSGSRRCVVRLPGLTHVRHQPAFFVAVAKPLLPSSERSVEPRSRLMLRPRVKWTDGSTMLSYEYLQIFFCHLQNNRERAKFTICIEDCILITVSALRLRGILSTPNVFECWSWKRNTSATSLRFVTN